MSTPPIISSQDFEWKRAVRQFRRQIDGLLCLSSLFSPVFKSLPKPHHWPPHVTVLWLLWGADRQDGVDMCPLWHCGLPGCLERWLAVLEWLAVPSLKRTSTWWASRVVPHSHCRLDSSAVMGSSSGCSSGTGSHLQAVYNYPLFLFSWERYIQSSKPVGQQPWHLTCVGAEPLPVSACWDHAASEPLLWSWEGWHQGGCLVCPEECQPARGIPLPFPTWILIYPWSNNWLHHQLWRCAPHPPKREKNIYEFLFPVKPIISWWFWTFGLIWTFVDCSVALLADGVSCEREAETCRLSWCQ